MSSTNAMEDHLLNYLLLDVVPPVLGTVYLALFTADPTESGSYTNEVTGGAYARQEVTFATPVDGTCSNSSVISFPIATALWGDISHYAIVTELTGTSGLMLFRDSIAVTQTIDTGARFQSAIGDFVIVVS